MLMAGSERTQESEIKKAKAYWADFDLVTHWHCSGNSVLTKFTGLC